jgi:hypothetical protein
MSEAGKTNPRLFAKDTIVSMFDAGII